MVKMMLAYGLFAFASVAIAVTDRDEIDQYYGSWVLVTKVAAGERIVVDRFDLDENHITVWNITKPVTYSSLGRGFTADMDGGSVVFEGMGNLLRVQFPMDKPHIFKRAK